MGLTFHVLYFIINIYGISLTPSMPTLACGMCSTAQDLVAYMKYSFPIPVPPSIEEITLTPTLSQISFGCFFACNSNNAAEVTPADLVTCVSNCFQNGFVLPAPSPPVPAAGFSEVRLCYLYFLEKPFKYTPFSCHNMNNHVELRFCLGTQCVPIRYKSTLPSSLCRRYSCDSSWV